jgi:hypothetical protein
VNVSSGGRSTAFGCDRHAALHASAEACSLPRPPARSVDSHNRLSIHHLTTARSLGDDFTAPCIVVSATMAVGCQSTRQLSHHLIDLGGLADALKQVRSSDQQRLQAAVFAGR